MHETWVNKAYCFGYKVFLFEPKKHTSYIYTVIEDCIVNVKIRKVDKNSRHM